MHLEHPQNNTVLLQSYKIAFSYKIKENIINNYSHGILKKNVSNFIVTWALGLLIILWTIL